MDQHFTTAASALDAAALDTTAAERTGVAAGAEQDAAGGITLKGRNRACARARVLAGMVLTSGIVITLSSMDTSVSAPR
ncbi:hypothetical protein KUM39_06575 [Streptomyces sp. J2-1]|uniref:hypothetical protein n=1 Tax=Streptomyces corallincola TaxID=2851888 RepID=UPI001C381006|nr:hypothetical protein [Streptomyces corallincola]MBV2354029.1 hypothetical protein [Streptomyces corallincola]